MNVGQTMKIQIRFILMILLIFPSLTKATNLVPGKLVNSFFYVGNDTSFQFEVRNDSVVTANQYSVNVSVTDSLNNTIFSETVEGKDLKPYTIDTLVTKKTWTPEHAGFYRFNAKVNFQYEVDPSDDSVSVEFPVLYPRLNFTSKLADKSLSLFQDSTFTWAFMKEDLLKPGDMLQSYDPRELEITLGKYAYLGWVDFGKDIHFAHPGYYVLYDAMDTTKIEEYRINWFPLINGTPYLSSMDERLNTPDRVRGSDPEAVDVTSASTVSSETNENTPGDSVCVLLVTGKQEKVNETLAWDFNTDIVAGNLTKEALGPRLPGASIRRLNEPSAEYIKAVLDSMKGKYKEIYFYYAGHGWKGSICTNDSAWNWLKYSDLAKSLYATGAKDVNVIIDACYSGSAVDGFSIPEGRNTNLTLLTASAKDTLSWFYVMHTMATGEYVWSSFFTWHLMKCFGDPNAESDGLEGISLKEAFDWLRIQNPELNGKKNNSLMDPQIYIHRAETTREIEIRPPDTDITIYRDTDFDTTIVTMLVDMKTTVEDTASNDTTMLDMSTYRYWSLDSDLSHGYSLELEFKYKPELEYWNIEATKPGIVRRDSAGEAWEVHDESDWDSTKYTIRAYDVTKMGDFAIGYVYDLTTDIAFNTEAVPDHYFLNQNYPNPFNPSTTIRFNLPESQHVKLHVFDLLGREVMILVDGEMRGGVHRVIFDAGNLPSGLYLVRLEAESFASVKRMMLVK